MCGAKSSIFSCFERSARSTAYEALSRDIGFAREKKHNDAPSNQSRASVRCVPSGVSGGFDRTAVQIENGHHIAETIVDSFGENGKVIGTIGNDLADDLTILEAQLRLVFAGNCAHFPVL